MNQPTAHIIPCPRCGKPAAYTPTNRFRPFCSERCKLIDFGAWADEEHCIPGEPAQFDIDDFPDESHPPSE